MDKNHDQRVEYDFNEQDLLQLPVSRRLLEMIPESLIDGDQLLAIHEANDELRVVTYRRQDSELVELMEKIKLVTRKNVTFFFAPLISLQQTIHKHFQIAYSTVQNCNLKFKFSCPEQWIEMTMTNDKRIRFCSNCQQNVYLCESLGEAVALGHEGKCVALIDLEDRYVNTIGMIDFE